MNVASLLVPPPQTLRASAGLLILRVFAGYAFMVHGWGKIRAPFSWMGPDAGTPGVFQALAAISEFGGGLAWMLGLLVPLASLGLASTMSVAVWTHLVKLQDPLISQGGRAAEPAAVYLCIALLLLLAGPGRFSLDQRLFRPRA